MTKISGVYKITNTITSDFYIGSSKDVKRRWFNHKCSSKWAQLHNSKLYKDMAQYGLDNFSFEVLEETNNLKEREQYWIDQLNPSYNNNRAKWLNKEGISYQKDYQKSHKDSILAYQKDYQKSHKDEWNTYQNEYYSKLCLYKDEAITLGALYHRFRKLGTEHPFREAKKYLKQDN